MTTDRDLERVLDDWFASGPTRVPDAVLTAALDRVAASGQHRARSGGLGAVGRWWSSGRSRIVVPLATIGVLVALIAGLLVATAGSDPDPLERFTSPRHGVMVEVPRGWTVEPASTDWSVTRPWDVGPGADVLTGDGLRFTIASRRLIEPVVLERWAAVFVPDRPDVDGPEDARVCIDPTGVDPTVIAVPGGSVWRPARIDGVEATVRVGCGHVDAVAILGPRAFVLSLSGQRQAGADVARFQAIIGGIQLREPTPTAVPVTPPAPPEVPTATAPTSPEPEVETVSPLYGYRMRHPGSWRLVPATIPWDGRVRAEDAAMADIWTMPRRLTVAAMPISTSIEAWITEHVRLPRAFEESRDGHRHCHIGNSYHENSPDPTWVQDEVAGRAAWLRDVCGTVDAVIPIDRGAVHLRMTFGRLPTSDLREFRAVTDRITLGSADSAVTPLDPDATVTVASARFGYAVEVPWVVRVRPATSSQPPAGLPGWVDSDSRFDAFDLGGRRAFSIASLPMTADLQTWVVGLRSRQQNEDGVRGCVDDVVPPPTATLPPERWVETTVGPEGHAALERRSCGLIDLVTVVDGRAYVITVRDPAPLAAADRDWLDAIIRTVDLRPEAATDRPDPSSSPAGALVP